MARNITVIQGIPFQVLLSWNNKLRLIYTDKEVSRLTFNDYIYANYGKNGFHWVGLTRQNLKTKGSNHMSGVIAGLTWGGTLHKYVHWLLTACDRQVTPEAVSGIVAKLTGTFTLPRGVSTLIPTGELIKTPDDQQRYTGIFIDCPTKDNLLAYLAKLE